MSRHRNAIGWLLVFGGLLYLAYFSVARADIFDASTREQSQSEREHANAYGRWQNGSKPPILFAALNTEPNCALHAVNAAHYLETHGIPRKDMRVAYGNVIGGYHAVLLVTMGGKDWAVDQGGLGTFSDGSTVCPENVCRADEALRAMSYVWLGRSG